jgi:predicted esterase
MKRTSPEVLFYFQSMEEKEIDFRFKARYYQLGELNSRTAQLWFVLHGYGQLAKFFVRKFEILTKHNICVIAPEGLSRFYLESFQPGIGRSNDRVGATWMTKENRATDISNYITYLDAVYHSVTGGTSREATILGFSQGAATASRWALNGVVEFRKLILWAGMFPPDMDSSGGKAVLGGKDVSLVYGTKDPFISDARFAELKDLRDRLGVKVRDVPFDGGHDVDEQTLLTLI